MPIDKHYFSTIAELGKPHGISYDFGPGTPHYANFCIPEQISTELKIVGFQIEKEQEGNHPGHPLDFLKPKV